MPSRAPKPVAGLSLAALKKRAHNRVHSQLKAGLLVRPDTCVHCGRNPGMGRDGRTLLQAHHHKGYLLPLDVEWLCAKCHRAETPSNPVRGEANANSKLTVALVGEIRASPLGTRALARQHGVTPALIRQVRLRKGWNHVR